MAAGLSSLLTSDRMKISIETLSNKIYNFQNPSQLKVKAKPVRIALLALVFPPLAPPAYMCLVSVVIG